MHTSDLTHSFVLMHCQLVQLQRAHSVHSALANSFARSSPSGTAVRSEEGFRMKEEYHVFRAEAARSIILLSSTLLLLMWRSLSMAGASAGMQQKALAEHSFTPVIMVGVQVWSWQLRQGIIITTALLRLMLAPCGYPCLENLSDPDLNECSWHGSRQRGYCIRHRVARVLVFPSLLSLAQELGMSTSLCHVCCPCVALGAMHVTVHHPDTACYCQSDSTCSAFALCRNCIFLILGPLLADVPGVHDLLLHGNGNAGECPAPQWVQHSLLVDLAPLLFHPHVSHHDHTARRQL
jgi:hypothetical protein